MITPMPASTGGCWRNEPNMPPVIAAITPSVLYMTIMPATYDTAEATTRGVGADSRVPKMDTVTPSIGYTHGVRLSPRPTPNSRMNAHSPPPDTASAIGSCRPPIEPTGFTGAAASEAGVDGVPAGGGAAAPGLVDG